MTCRKPLGCGHEFCWVCLDPWNLHSKETGGYYKCNIYAPDKIRQRNALNKDN